MPFLQLLVLALVQGITEFLPISSSAHLILAPMAVEDWQTQDPAIDVAAHVGSLGAVLLYFRQETTSLFTGAWKTLTGRKGEDQQLFFMLAVASIPLLAVGAFLALTGWIAVLRNPLVIGIASIVFGILLWHSDRPPAGKAKEPDEISPLPTLSWKPVLMIGAAQMLALIPGASRSGVTMTAARYLGWNRSHAARFSMLLAIPSIAALGLFAFLDLITGTLSEARLSDGVIVAILSFISAYATIHIFLRLVERLSFTPFVLYRIAMGIILIGLTMNFA